MVALANVDTTYDGPLLLCMDDHRLKHVTASCFHFVGISRSACEARTSKYCIFRGKGVRYIHTTNYFAIDESDESRLWIRYVVFCARPYLRGMALPYLLMTGWLCRQGFVCRRLVSSLGTSIAFAWAWGRDNPLSQYIHTRSDGSGCNHEARTVVTLEIFALPTIGVVRTECVAFVTLN